MRAVLLQDLSATRRDTCWSNVPQALHTLIPAVQVDPASRIDVHRSVVSTVVSSAVKSITRAVQPQDDSRTSLAVDTAPSDEIGSPKPMHHGKHIDRSELNDSTLLVSCQPLSDATVSAQSQVSTPKIGISVLLVDQFNLAPAGNPISVKHQTNSRNGTESEASDRLALDALNTHLTSVNRSGINKSTDAVFTGSLESIVPDQDEFRSRQYTDSDLSLGDATIEDDFDIDSLF